ncbi:MAG TPA: beta-ketoacyl synthase N-terminal-like domain-containing protein [Jatrophihabitans sp.]|nr:beta-ketoacyl synthase N-terminal-like domain-containing protein [Jatrophihabitans sp.]
MNAAASVVATAWSLHLPDLDIEPALTERFGPLGDWARQPAAPPDQAATVLGRKGMLYKEPATRLALCAVHRAFGVPAGQRPGWPAAPGTAVVVASNLGNVETVARVTRTIDTEGGSAVSVLDAPNVSSNVIASTVALWFGFGAANLMICSGAGAGLDGLALAVLLLRAGRADRVVLVGVEPADPVATELFGAGSDRPALRAGAACLVLEQGRPENGTGPSGRRRLAVQLSDDARVDDAQVDDARVADARALDTDSTIGPGGFDPARHWGDFYGAQDVVALALAAELAAEGHRQVGVRGTGRPSRQVLLGTAGSRS